MYLLTFYLFSLFNDAGLPRKKSTDFDKEFQDNTRVREFVNFKSLFMIKKHNVQLIQLSVLKNFPARGGGRTFLALL